MLNFRHAFRESERYGKDVEALLGEVSRRFPVAEWTVWLKNKGKADTTLIKDIQGLDFTFEREP